MIELIWPLGDQSLIIHNESIKTKLTLEIFNRILIDDINEDLTDSLNYP